MQNAETTKKEEMYKFWVRPTISWKLECEESFTRWEVSTKLSELDKEEDKLPARLTLYSILFGF